ncbi:MAG: dethiobiotin synthase [Gammaproteobacteria bacterium]
MNYFIAGTDTGAGKTAVTAGLLAAWRSRGRRVAGMKPVAAGTDAVGRNEDVDALAAASTPGLPAAALNPYLFPAPTSPHVAARLAGARIDVALLDAAYATLAAATDQLLVEGAGGWRVPLTDAVLMSDLARRWQLPVVLVAGIRLGAINHTLLTVEAIARDGCRLRGWIANVVDPVYAYADATIDTLIARIEAPCLVRLPFVPGLRSAGLAERLTDVASALEDPATLPDRSTRTAF